MATEHPAPPDRLPGRATMQGTERYADKFAELHPSHFRLCHDLVFSSIGIGTYLGDPTDAVDDAYQQSVTRAVSSGCNVIDTAINYRFQRSERSVGAAIADLVANGFARDEIVVCTKGGFIPFDNDMPKDPYKWIEKNLLAKGIVTPEEIHPDGHCMAPMFLYNQIEQSLKNLNLETVDVYYLHNPETQMTELNDARFYEAVEMAFRTLENAVSDGKIGSYGVATWDGFLDDSGSGRLLQLERMVDLARRAGGEQHHFRMVELPINLEMTDALNDESQKVGDKNLTFLDAARMLNICVVGSASLLQSALARNLPITLQQAIPNLPDDAARALQFARSIPGVGTALVGMSNTQHVTSNMELANLPILSDDEFNTMFGER